MNTLMNHTRDMIERKLLKEDKASLIVTSVLQQISHYEPLIQLKVLCRIWDSGENYTLSKTRNAFIYNIGLETTRLYRQLGGSNMRTLHALRVHVRHDHADQTLFTRLANEGLTVELQYKLSDYLESIDEYIPVSRPRKPFELMMWSMIHDDVNVASDIISSITDTATNIILKRIKRYN